VNASKTLVAHNRIRNIRVFPNSFVPSGFGVFVDENSHGNKLIRNRFLNNEDFDIALYGDQNMVIAQSKQDKILDEGEENVIMGQGIKMNLTSRNLEQNRANIARKIEQTRQFFTQLIDRAKKIEISASESSR